MAIDDYILKAREEGYTQDQIGAYIQSKKQAALANGYTEDEVNKYLGYKGGGDDKLKETIDAQRDEAHPPAEDGIKTATNWMDAFHAGLQGSVSGLAARNKLPDTHLADDASTIMRVASSVGQELGDLPTQIVGGVLGSVAGPVGTGAGAIGLTEAMRARYMDMMKNGQLFGAKDFADRAAGIAWEGAKGAAAGAVGGKVGQVAEGLVAPLALEGAAKLTATGTTLVAQAEAATVASKALEGQLPTKNELIDGAILAVGFAGATKASELAKPHVEAIKENLANHWVATGQRPIDAMAMATKDPVFRGDIQTPKQEVPPEASVTKAEDGQFVVPQMVGASREEVEQTINNIRETEKATLVDIFGSENTATQYQRLDRLRNTASSSVDSDRYQAQFDALVQGLSPEKVKRLESIGVADELGAVHDAVRETDFSAENTTQEVAQEASYAVRQLNKSDLTAVKNGSADGYQQSNVIRFLRSTKELQKRGLSGEEIQAKLMQNLSREVSQEDARFLIDNLNDIMKSAKPSKVRGFLTDESGQLKLVEPHEPHPDADVQSVLDRIGTENKPGMSMSEFGQAMYKEMIDDKAPVRKLIDAATEGKDLKDAANPEFLLRLSDNSPSQAHYVITKNMTDLEGNITGKGLESIVSDLDYKGRQEFTAYAVAKRALDQKGKSLETGVDWEKARSVVQKFGAKYESRFRDLNDYQNATTKWLVDSGLMNEQAATKMYQANRNFVPFHRISDEAPARVAGKGKSVYNPVKAFTGSDKQIVDPLQSIVKNTYLLHQLAARNKAGLAMVDSLKEAGLAEQSFTGKTYKLSEGELQKLSQKADTDLADVDMSIFRPGSRQTAKDEIVVYRDGKPETWKLADPEVAQILKGMDQDTRTVWDKMMAFPTKVQRAAITLAPSFPIRQIMMDLPWRFIEQKGWGNTAADFYTGFRNIVGKTELYDKWVRNGGMGHTIYDAHKEYVESGILQNADKTNLLGGIWNAVKTPYEFLEAYGRTLEDSKRLGEYIRGRKEGQTEEEATARSIESYLDFARQGTVARRMNAVIPFLSARLNGMERSVRAIADRPIETTAKAAAIITVPVLSNWALNKDKDWYKALNPIQKDLCLNFRVGGDDPGKGTTISIPLPPVYGFLYGALPRRMMDAFIAQNPEAWNHTQGSLLNETMPSSFMSTALLPVVEHVSNYSFFKGHELVPGQLQDKVLAPERYNAYTSETAKQLSRVFDDLPLVHDFQLSPIVIDNYIRQWGGTLGTAAVSAADKALVKTGVVPDPVKPEASWADIPFFQSFAKRYPSSSDSRISDFYDRNKQLEQTKGSLAAALKAEDFGRYNDLAQKNPLALSKLNLASGAFDNLNKISKAIMNNKGISPKDKRQLLDQNYGTMAMIAEQGNKLLDELGQ